MRWLPLFLVLLAVGLDTAAAAPKPTAAEQAAKSAFEKAAADYKLQRYEEALAGFEEAYRLTNEPSILFNIGQCYKQLERFDEALRAFRAFLRDAPAQSPQRPNAEARIQEIEQELARLAKTGTLTLSTKQDPAEIWLDAVSRGLSPITLPELSPGEHALRITKSGFAEYTATITIKPSETTNLEALSLVPLSIKEEPLAKNLRWVALGVGAGGLASVSAAALLAVSVGRAQDKLVNGDDLDDKRDSFEERLTLSQVAGFGGVGLLATSAATAWASARLQKKANEMKQDQEGKP
jgi:hypothetical protein